jgi:bifunctional non-homologous end joining protein LigD
MSQCKHESLAMREGSADKVYKIWLSRLGGETEGPDDLWYVQANWGRRGQTLQEGRKCKDTTYAEALKCFDKVVKEKLAKGYKQIEGPVPDCTLPTSGHNRPDMPRVPAGERTGPSYFPQLLNPVTEGEAEALLRQSNIGAQKKYDGVRRILIKRGDQVTSLNKKGIQRAIASEIADYAKNIKGDFVMDGEAIGADFYAFDLLERDGEDLRPLAYGTRYNALLKIIGGPNGWPIHPVPMAIGENQIRKFLKDLKAMNAEGICLKDLLAPYTAGDKHNTQFKYKFVESISVVVIGHNEKRSVSVALYIEDGKGLCMGNVSIPVNHEVPPVGSVIEVRYLYVGGVGGALVQPVYIGPREDVLQSECTVEKQKPKYRDAAELTCATEE